MKELTIEQKAREYDEAKARMSRAWNENRCPTSFMNEIFPEVEIDEDEKIRKWLIGYFQRNKVAEVIKTHDILAWLDKQGEQKNKISFTFKDILALECSMKTAKLTIGGEQLYELLVPLYNKIHNAYLLEIEKQVEKKPIIDGILTATNYDKMYQNYNLPKFKVGDWIVKENIVYHIDKISGVYLTLSTIDGTALNYHSNVLNNDKIHLWTIQDAKDGDVLAGGDWVFIFRKFHINGFPKCHCHYDMTLKEFKVDTDSYMASGGENYPATKEQRELLFAKMKENGYEWSEETHELKKIDKIAPKFKVGDFIVNDYCFGKVIEITNDAYLLDTGQGIPFSCEHNAHLWTISDAKDGDVLVDEDNNIGIFEECEGICWHSYIYLGCDGKLRGFSIGGSHKQTDTHPVTKRQRDTLFAKIKEAGYEWEAEKKELRKIE